MSGRVAWISLTPVKATALQLVDEVELLESGPRATAGSTSSPSRAACSTTRTAARCSSCGRSTTSAPTRCCCASPDGAVVSGPVERGEELETRFHSRPRSARLVRGPWAEAVSSLVGERVRLVEPPHGAADRGRSGAATLLGTASLARARSRRSVSTGRRPPLPHELRDRRSRAARGGRLARSPGRGRRGGRRAPGECRPLRRHDPEP